MLQNSCAHAKNNQTQVPMHLIATKNHEPRIKNGIALVLRWTSHLPWGKGSEICVVVHKI